jgi:hypothetical protein
MMLSIFAWSRRLYRIPVREWKKNLRFFTQFSQRIVRLLPARAIALRLQVMGGRPFANANAGLQAILVCGSKVNAAVYPAYDRFFAASSQVGKLRYSPGRKSEPVVKAISVCSAVRVEPKAAPSCLTSL